MTEFEKNSIKITLALVIYDVFKNIPISKNLAIEILNYVEENIDEAGLKEE